MYSANNLVPCARRQLGPRDPQVSLAHLDVVGSVEFLVGRVRTIVPSSDGQQANVQSKSGRKIQRDGDRTTFAGVVGCLAPDRLGGFVSGTERVVLRA